MTPRPTEPPSPPQGGGALDGRRERLHDGTVEHLLQRLHKHRALARAALLFEQVWPAVWPALGVAGLWLCLALFGVPLLLPPLAHIVLLAAFGLTVLALLVRGLRRVRRPSLHAADRRLERDSGLRHQPLATLLDRPAIAGPDGEALWRAHVGRAALALRRLRVGLPHPNLAAQDRMALRNGLVVALAAGLVVAGPEAPDRLMRAFTPTLPGAAAAPAPLLQAWITPPAYTDQPPLFLRPEGGAVTVPAGSRLTVSLTGGRGEPSLLLDGAEQRFRALDQASWQAEGKLHNGGRLLVRRNGRVVAAWDVATVVDTPPVVAFAAPPGPAEQGAETRLPWKATDDYGVTALRAELHLRDRPDAPPLVVSIPLNGHPKSAHGVAMRDLTAHPWAGLPVTARLIGRDGAGQEGHSDTAQFVLPEREFHNKVARALVELRKGLTLHPEDRRTAIAGLRELMAAPEDFDNDAGVFLNLGAIAALLRRDHAAEAVDQAQARMWTLAIHLEDGAVARTARAEQAAREAVQQELEQLKQGKGDLTELDRRIRTLEDAIRRHLEALAQRARQQDLPQDPSAQRLEERDLDKMIQQMRDAARAGRTQEAEQRLAELQQLLDRIQSAEMQNGQASRQAQAQRRGQQQKNALEDMLRREQGLLDHASRRQAGSQNSPQNGQQDGQDSPLQDNPGLPDTGRQSGAAQSGSPDPAQQRGADARTQQALRRALGELMQEFGDLTGKVPGGLGEADTAMAGAAQALRQGSDAAAGAAQRKAIAALQKGGQQMAQEMAKQFGPGQGQGEQQGQMAGQQDGTAPGQGRRQGAMRDPLGRQTGPGGEGQMDGSDVRVPDKMEQARTREIQQELRRRESERTRPQQELDYINRLLKPF